MKNSKTDIQSFSGQARVSQFITKVNPPLAILFTIVIAFFSVRPWLTTLLILLAPIIGTGLLKLGAKLEKSFVLHITIINGTLNFLVALLAGHIAPCFLLGFTNLVFCTFQIKNKTYRVFAYLIYFVAVTYGSFLAGVDWRQIFYGNLALLSFLVILIRTLQFVVGQGNEIAAAKTEIQVKNEEIVSSIAYAKRIQSAILPNVENIYKTLENSFVLFKPKDVVSGDFYAFAEKNGHIILAAVDCTGHGVPGAFMSMIGHNLLNEIIVERNITKPSHILEELNKSVRKALKQNENNTKDGMDAVIVAIDVINQKLQYAGANRPLLMIRNNELTEIKATKTAIGGHTDENQKFENHEIILQKDDTFYLSSDGYADQFGGAQGKKMMTKKFKKLLLEMQNQSMRAQETALNKAFEDWKGEYEQVDDVLVIGVKI